MPSIAIVGGIGPLEIGIVLLIVLIIFGPKRIPELGRSLGAGMRGFRDAVTGKDSDEEHERLERPAGDADTADEQREGERTARSGAGTTGDGRS